MFCYGYSEKDALLSLRKEVVKVMTSEKTSINISQWMRGGVNQKQLDEFVEVRYSCSMWLHLSTLSRGGQRDTMYRIRVHYIDLYYVFAHYVHSIKSSLKYILSHAYKHLGSIMLYWTPPRRFNNAQNYSSNNRRYCRLSWDVFMR